MRRETQKPRIQLRCAQCGGTVRAKNIVHCADCLFIYCDEHASSELHLCAVICRECPPD